MSGLVSGYCSVGFIFDNVGLINNVWAGFLEAAYISKGT